MPSATKANCLPRTVRRIFTQIPVVVLVLGLTQAAHAFDCPPKGPVAAGSRVTVVYDPGDSSMKACVGSSWVALAGGGGATSLDGLTDVVITAPALNHALVYDGTNWINSAITVSESDPQVGTLTANKWCAANVGGTAIDCTADAPSGGSSQWTDGTGGAIYYNSGSVGIGSTNPSVSLHVHSDTYNSHLRLSRGSTHHYGFTLDGAGNALQTGNSPDYGFGNNNIYIKDANSGLPKVGIGTTSPNYKLQVDAAGTQAYFRDPTLFTGLLISSDATGANIRSSNIGHKLTFGLGSTEFMRIAATSGNVGIGTATPSTLLHLYGGAVTATLQSTTNTAQLDLTNTGTTARLQAANNDLAILLGGVHRMRINAAGNVGIGTTTPDASALLDISSTTKGILLPRLTTAQVGAVATPADGLIVYDIDTDTIKLRANGAWASLGGGGTPGGADTQVQFNDGGAFGGDSKLVFNKTTGQLTVTGNIAATSTTATSTLSSSTSLSGGVAQVYLNNTGAGGTNWSINAGNTATGGGLGANLGIAEGSNYRLAIAQGGNVGIGTTSPSGRLHVYNDQGGGGGRIILDANVTSGYETRIDVTDNGLELTAKSNIRGHIFNTGTTPTEKMRISGNGNVGIGTTTPSDRLHVRGSSTTAIHVEGASSGYYNAALVLRSTSDTNYRGSGLFMHDLGGSNEWFIGRPYAAADQIIFARKSGVASHDGGSTAQVANALFTFSSAGAAAKPGGGSWAATSDIRLKTVDGPYMQGLESVGRLETVRFHYKKDNPRGEPSERSFVGLVAQDVQKVFPEAVTQRADGYLDLDTTPINFALINAIKELKAANDGLKAVTDDQAVSLHNQATELRALREAFEDYKAKNP